MPEEPFHKRPKPVKKYKTVTQHHPGKRNKTVTKFFSNLHKKPIAGNKMIKHKRGPGRLALKGESPSGKRGRGRPPGSKNKPKTHNEVVVKKRGRPPGSTNKAKKPDLNKVSKSFKKIGEAHKNNKRAQRVVKKLIGIIDQHKRSPGRPRKEEKPTVAKKTRGRPRKNIEPVVKRGRGRPKKVEAPIKRGRGRPRKETTPIKSNPVKRGRGRPPGSKNKPKLKKFEKFLDKVIKRGPGRPRKTTEPVVKKKRGRPRKVNKPLVNKPATKTSKTVKQKHEVKTTPKFTFKSTGPKARHKWPQHPAFVRAAKKPANVHFKPSKNWTPPKKKSNKEYDKLSAETKAIASRLNKQKFTFPWDHKK